MSSPSPALDATGPSGETKPADSPIEIYRHSSAHLLAAAFSPDGELLATVSRDQRVLVWQHTNSHKTLGQVLLGGPLRALAFAPDGKGLATGSEDREVAIWELGGAAPVRSRRRLLLHAKRRRFFRSAIVVSPPVRERR